jgi:hypothetical protein
MRVNLSGSRSPLRGGRASPRAAKALEANGVFLVLDQGELWVPGTTDREDAIPSGGCRIDGPF